MLTSEKPGVKYEFKRNPNYWKAGAAHADSIEIRLPQDKTASADFQEEEAPVLVLRFHSVEKATEWFAETQKLCAPSDSFQQPEPKLETNDEQPELARV